ncbi:Sas4p LALA0_S03e03246g [Lachancea lanzarotensis]|uniref:LALA0S03e03246g1_1 n=1 Tax=Lachancea lanzarotensis TaxID=1245769 RepID=A0A0C7N7T6_9SACH|nr:uncharacterized protein LALA0_S03e03246g [Lachancea lanzarotensis]CEP61455.1 LALA0S03e03246g1_1 [Lachancea lanzarotensis]
MTRRPERKLRSTSPSNTSSDGLFDFDNDENGIPASGRLTVVSRLTGETEKVHDWVNSDEVERKKQELQKMEELVMEKHPLEEDDEVDESEGKWPNGDIEGVLADPLSDELYTSYHRKMQRQEVRMVNQDKVQSETEAERLRGILEGLESQNWLKTLLHTTKIRNSGDFEEISCKRRLTQDAINNMLANFSDFKNRVTFMGRNGRLGNAKNTYARSRTSTELPNARINHYRRPPFGYGDTNLCSDDEEESMTIAEIKAHRKRLKEKKFGGSVVIQLRKSASSHYNFAIIAEPLQSAYIVKCTKAEKEVWSRKSESLPIQFESCEQFPTQTYTSRRIHSPPHADYNGNDVDKSPEKRTFDEIKGPTVVSLNSPKQVKKTRKQKTQS